MYNLIDTDNYPWIALIQKKDWKHDDCQASYKEHLFSVSHTETKNMWIMTSKLPVAFRTLVCSCLFNLTQYFLLSLGTCLSTRSHHSLKTAGFRLITASGLRKSYHLALIITNTQTLTRFSWHFGWGCTFTSLCLRIRERDVFSVWVRHPSIETGHQKSDTLLMTKRQWQKWELARSSIQTALFSWSCWLTFLSSSSLL